MMQRTDRHERYFLRLLSRHVLLYTEMVAAAAIFHGDKDKLLGYHPDEKPVALQLGGSNVEAMTLAAREGEARDYDEININVGCPSDRVKAGHFGACLMAEPHLVAACVNSMQDAVGIPVTVKTRLGIDDLDAYEDLVNFISVVSAAGCKSFTIHARKAWLTGISPRENREIPPLHYDRVHRLKRDFPHLEIVINGGITSLKMAREQLTQVDGVMIGREVYRNPYLLAEADEVVYGDPAGGGALSRKDAVKAMLPYVEAEVSKGTRLHHIARHLVGLYRDRPGARDWRRILTEGSAKKNAGPEVLERALAATQNSIRAT